MLHADHQHRLYSPPLSPSGPRALSYPLYFCQCRVQEARPSATRVRYQGLGSLASLKPLLKRERRLQPCHWPHCGHLQLHPCPGHPTHLKRPLRSSSLRLSRVGETFFSLERGYTLCQGAWGAHLPAQSSASTTQSSSQREGPARDGLIPGITSSSLLS